MTKLSELEEKFTTKLYKNPKDHDSDDLPIFLGDERVGFAYVGRKSGKIGLIRCPNCRRENYMPAVSSGQCVWCGFDGNSLLITQEK